MHMTGRKARLAGAGVVALAVALLGAAPVLANERDWFVVVFDPEPVDHGFCSFPTLMTEEGTFKVADYFDKSGTLYRTIVTSYGQLTLTITNPANAKTVTTHNESQVIIVDWLPDGLRERIRRIGISFAFTFPGSGVVMLNTGYLEHDYLTGETRIAGPHDLVAEDFTGLCSALA
jgi:hypothetical protein